MLRIALFLCAFFALPAAAQVPQRPAQPDDGATVEARLLAGVKLWGYQLQGARVQEIARSPFDLVVVDYSRDGQESGRFSRSEIGRMQRKPDGSRRLVLAYLSIGEAEDYRFYWDPTWITTAPSAPPAAPLSAPLAPAAGASPLPPSPPTTAPSPDGGGAPPAPTDSAAGGAPAKPSARPQRVISATAPAWLGDENETWSGNYQVGFWDPDWQKVIYGTPQSYLERILAAGFDGVYLDRVDAYYDVAGVRPTAADEMIRFVAALGARARAIDPHALVVVQNAEELLLQPPFVAAIDGIAKEDLLYGSPAEGAPNHAGQIANSLFWLSHATRQSRPVLVVEYLEKPEAIAAARSVLETHGFAAYFGPRTLDKLVPPMPRVSGGR